MKSWEYIIQTKRSDIDYINKIFEACEDLGNVRTLDSHAGLVKIITSIYFLDDVDRLLLRLQREGIMIEILEKREWLGIL